MKKIVLIIFSLAIGLTVYAQCDSRLLEQAASQSGTDALFIRDFKVKLEKGTMKRPSPTGRFQVYLNAGIHYRFNVANASEYEGEAILQLYDRSRLSGSTYDTENRIDKKMFDFICEKSGNYQVLMSFNEGKSGCAAAVMSMVLSDTMTAKSIIPGIASDGMEKLYIGIDNELNIAATDIPGGKLEVSISRGTIEGANGRYIVRVDNKGIVTVKVNARDKTGKINETDSINFIVTDIPLPAVTLDGMFEGPVLKQDIDKLNELTLYYSFEIDNKAYTVTEFSISDEKSLGMGAVSYSHRITPAQKSFLNSLNPGERFIIKEIYVRGRNGAVHRLAPVIYYIE
ncbi:MAG: GldM family protein [Bacteroidales bacterium]